MVDYTKKYKNDYKIICTLIVHGFSTTQIAKKIKLSWPTVLKIVRIFNESNILSKLKQNNNHSRAKGFKSVAGHSRGKTYEQLYGSKATEMKQKRSKWLKKNNIRKFAKRISKPQRLLYEIVLHKFPTAILDYEFKIKDDHKIYLDIAIPELKINIECDGMYWHNLNQKTIRTPDKKRDKILKQAGWKVYRMQYNSNPSKEMLASDFYSIIIQ